MQYVTSKQVVKLLRHIPPGTLKSILKKGWITTVARESGNLHCNLQKLYLQAHGLTFEVVHCQYLS
jgi:hypothetical protein